MPQRFWNVYSHVARSWYELEYGQIEQPDRWYQPAMLFLERFAVAPPDSFDPIWRNQLER